MSRVRSENSVTYCNTPGAGLRILKLEIFRNFVGFAHCFLSQSKNSKMSLQEVKKQFFSYSRTVGSPVHDRQDAGPTIPGEIASGCALAMTIFHVAAPQHYF